MKHISAIEKLIEGGEVVEARSALDNLLELGPNNLDALKLQALIFSSEGKFKEEERVWYRILEIANDDEDAIEYVQQRQIDFYFTDDLPGGGRRFVAYSRALVKISFIGLMGCISFLLLTKVASQRGWQLTPEGIGSAFLVMVILPWVAIIYTWVRSLRNITVSYEGIDVLMRFRRLFFRWEDIKEISLVSTGHPGDPNLRLIIESLNPEIRSLVLDLNEDSSSIRARSFLVNEILAHRPQIQICHETDVDINGLSPVYC